MVFHKIKMKALYNFFVYFLDKCFPKNNIDSSVETAELYISDPDPDPDQRGCSYNYHEDDDDDEDDKYHHEKYNQNNDKNKIIVSNRKCDLLITCLGIIIIYILLVLWVTHIE
jgi:hypothetical protein